eukprot:scaffold244685_cov27-Tisochrysis_lutea.AAC.2
MEMTAGFPGRVFGGRRTAIVPGVARSCGSANLLEGGCLRRSRYVQPYGSARAMASARPRPSQPTQLACCAIASTCSRSEGSRIPPGRKRFLTTGVTSTAAAMQGSEARGAAAGSSSAVRSTMGG